MKLVILISFFFIPITFFGQKKALLGTFGFDYRDAPIDIEDAPRNGYTTNSSFYGLGFWQAPSVLLKFGCQVRDKWIFSLAGYARHNHQYWLEKYNPTDLNNKYRKEKKNFKYDLIFALERKLLLKRAGRNLFASLGAGMVNLNTEYDVIIPDPSVSNNHYKGSLMQFAPRISVGYQYHNFKLSFDCYVVEGHDMANLTALWLGGTLCYEFCLNPKALKK